MSRRSFIDRSFSLAAALPMVGLWSSAHRRELGELASEWREKYLPTPEPIGVPRSDAPQPRPSTCEPRFSGTEKAYASYLGGLGLRHIRPHEVINAHHRTRCGVPNHLPPRELWERLGPTLKVADEMRERLGVPLRVIASVYRSPAYNAQCPGAATRSQHIENRALDLIFDTSPEHVARMAKHLRAEGFFRGGVGLYPSFVHVDTRGYNATW
ncbi:YcbK family protein [Haloferula sargassicola]|uniref:Peptidase M15A C-terminal domain-containing protein n=1 Tax=Haloferula sargassicola TaxID=490096 RepID=A0ABP9URB3_9BACT